MTTLCPSVPSTHALVNDDVVLCSEMFRKFWGSPRESQMAVGFQRPDLWCPGGQCERASSGEGEEKTGPAAMYTPDEVLKFKKPTEGERSTADGPGDIARGSVLNPFPSTTGPSSRGAESRQTLGQADTPSSPPRARAPLSLSFSLSLSLSLTLPSGFCCSLSDNKYGIEFLEFEIRDYDTSKSVFKVSLGSGLARALRRDARSSSNPFLSLPARYRRATPPT